VRGPGLALVLANAQDPGQEIRSPPQPSKPDFKLKEYEMINLDIDHLIQNKQAKRLPVFKKHELILKTIL
jgi:hypothetical protein